MLSRTLVIIMLCSVCHQVFSEEYVEKKAGVSFRFDDNQSVKLWKPMIGLFDEYGFKAGLSINSGLLKNKELANYLKEAQDNGHEIMNHTPYHRYYVMRMPDAKSAQKYKNKSGVDHIRENLICFKYSAPDQPPKPKAFTNGTITKGGKIKFEKSRHVRGFYTAPFYFEPYDKNFYVIGKKADADGFYQLFNIWREPVTDIKPMNNVRCVFESSALRLSADALKIEGEIAHSQFKRWGFKAPVTWIHPGCGEPLVNVDTVKKSYGEKYNYISGAVYILPALKLFNEFDPDDTRRFAMQWGNFRSAKQSVETMKTVIADSIACNRVAFDGSHMHGSKKLGGQEGYLKRMDTLLEWLKSNDIPVKTQAEWAETLYLRKPNPNTNVFPSIDIDLDENSIPDGFVLSRNTKVKKTKGKGNILASTGKGLICKVNKLGGLEKGANSFGMEFKADKGVKVTVSFIFVKGGRKTLTFFGTGEWDKYSEELVVPVIASYANVSVQTNSPQPVEIRSFSLIKCATKS